MYYYYSLAIIFLILNLITYTMVYYDKRKAKRGEWRVPEKRFFGLAILGGAIGVFVGMRSFRHKTKHPTFVYGIPFLIFINLVSYFYLLFQLPLHIEGILTKI